MSMSKSVIGQREEDDEFRKHIQVVQVCRAAGVSLPKETLAYLGDAAEYDNVDVVMTEALSIEIEKITTIKCGDGYEDTIVDLSDLPKGVKKLIFRLSW